MKKTNRNTDTLRNTQSGLENRSVNHLTAQEIEDEVLQIIYGGNDLDLDDVDACW